MKKHNHRKQAAEVKEKCIEEGCSKEASAAQQRCWTHYRFLQKLARGEVEPGEAPRKRPDGGGYVYVGTRVEPDVAATLSEASASQGIGVYTLHRRIMRRWAMAYKEKHGRGAAPTLRLAGREG